MGKILKKIFVDYLPDEKLEIVYALSFFAFLAFAVQIILLYNGILQVEETTESTQSLLSSARSEDKGAAFSEEEKLLEIPEELDARDVPTEEMEEPEKAEEKVDAPSPAKIVPRAVLPAKVNNSNKHMIAADIKTPAISAGIKKKDGLRVCAKKGDDPHDSHQNKSIHIDKECCLDPDEIPNPRCYYSPKKYGKLLEKYEKNKEKKLEKYRKKH